MAWDRDLANIVGDLKDIIREIETAQADIKNELDDTKKTAFDEGYDSGYSARQKEEVN